jgi:hypothetical protein
MLIDEAAQHLVRDYMAIGTPRMSHFSQLVSFLCILYPAAPVSLIMQEVVRNYSKAEKGAASRVNPSSTRSPGAAEPKQASH